MREATENKSARPLDVVDAALRFEMYLLVPAVAMTICQYPRKLCAERRQNPNAA